MRSIFDIAIIGGGINGCAVAADAALRGLTTVLIEKDDLASKTSSASSKLIHGGLRYLEQYQFSLVKKALTERQRLLKLAPHLIHPIPFVLPHDPKMRSGWLIRAGLFLYDYLSTHNRLPKSKGINSSSHPLYFDPLKSHIKKSFIFYDCITDDARLTISNALQAKKNGAEIYPFTQITHAEVKNNLWHLYIQSKEKQDRCIQARTVINATGPWVESTNQLLNISTALEISLVKGSHFLVPKLFEGDQAYFLQHQDKRIIFVIPYQGCTMIGTTEILLNKPEEKVMISQEEIDYLCHSVSHYFKIPIRKESIITDWSGIRPLLASAGKKTQCLNRDYAFDVTANPAPSISIYGGKITTYRQLAVEVVDALKPFLKSFKKSKTANTFLPGGELNGSSYTEYKDFVHQKYHWLPIDLRNRYLSTYGTLTEKILSNCNDFADLGCHFGHGLYETEVNYLYQEEWASDIESILWRRTKLGLQFSEANKEKLSNYLTFLKK